MNTSQCEHGLMAAGWLTAVVQGCVIQRHEAFGGTVVVAVTVTVLAVGGEIVLGSENLEDEVEI
jgi:hypothetical protein